MKDTHEEQLSWGLLGQIDKVKPKNKSMKNLKASHMKLEVIVLIIFLVNFGF